MARDKGRPEPVRLRIPGHVDDDIYTSALDVHHEMDGRKSRYIKGVLDWLRKEDAGDLRKSELNDLVEPSRGNVGQVSKSWENETSGQNIVINAKFVKHIVMHEKFVENRMMNAKINPKVMDLSTFKKLVDGTLYGPATSNYWKKLLKRAKGGC